jgi:hypothetical protein
VKITEHKQIFAGVFLRDKVGEGLMEGRG